MNHRADASSITSQRRFEYAAQDRSKLASIGWHADITFEPVPSDYAVLKVSCRGPCVSVADHSQVHTNPDEGGGDTLWASGYEVYSRLSPGFAKYLEGLEAVHEGTVFKYAADNYGINLRTGQRGSPLNSGDSLRAVHPVIRVSKCNPALMPRQILTAADPVTGWKSVFVNREFTKRILGVTRDESDLILDYLSVSNPSMRRAPLTPVKRLVKENHDLQVRFHWSTKNKPGRGDVALWDNRSNFHTVSPAEFMTHPSA